jgi:hypothetical protein
MKRRSLIEPAPSANELRLLSRADYQLSQNALSKGDVAAARASLSSAVCNAMIAYRVNHPNARPANAPSVIEVWSSIRRSGWWR